MTQFSRILVVDDEPDLEMLVTQKFRRAIRNNEMAFVFARNGKEALEKFSGDGPFDMVMTDINMPVMDGLTLLGHLKELNRHAKTIVVSAYGDLENIRVAMNRGAFDFVTKPIDFNDLEHTLRKTLDEVAILNKGLKAQDELAGAQLEKEIAELEKRKAQESEQMKQQFLANMSHEIRTPMNAILGLSKLMLKTELDEVQDKYMNAIKASAENLLVIINDILDFSKIESGKLEFEQTVFSLSEALDTVFNTLRFKAEEKSLQLLIKRDDTIPDNLIGDTVRLGQILINLAGNAIKFTTTGSVTISVSLKEKGTDHVTLHFSVQDTGIGIPEEKLDTIFESFTQASSDTTRKFGGTGLGLSISKQLVELQGGSIGVSSRFGEGTDFFFNLSFPVDKEHTQAKPEEADGPPDTSVLEGIRILLVEDNPFNQMVAIDTLESLIPGIQIDVAENGQEGFDKVSSNLYRLVLMDIQMPILDGNQATRKIRAEAPEPNRYTPIMAMTASATKEERERCAESGMDDYISKPFEVNDLLNRIIGLSKLTLTKRK